MNNKKIILIVLVFLVVCYFDYTFILQAQFKSAEEVGEKIINTQKNIDKLNKELSNLEEQKRKMAGTSKEAILKAKKIIADEEIPLLLNEISDIANNNQIKIMQLKPAKEVKDLKHSNTPKAEAFGLRLITLELICDYHNFGKFLNILENNQVFLAVEELKISPIAGNYFSQNVRTVLKTYVRE